MTVTEMRSVPVSVLERLLGEDVADGDLTTASLGIGGLPGAMEFRARQAMTVAGSDVAAGMIEHAGAEASLLLAPGARAEAGALILTAKGPAAALHKSWKAAQTLVEILSGIATATRALVDAVQAANPETRVVCTRKTVPGARRLSMMAIRAGGAIPHRLGLSETILVFAEHRVFMPGASPADIAARLRREAPEKKLGVEVATVAEAREAIEAGFDIVQLEKMTPADVAAVSAATRASPHRVLIAAAGGVSPDNAGAFVRAGAGLIVSSWPYTARPADVAVTIRPAQ
ncbi:MAG: ModD protein [Rhodomicrobium sp.]